MNKYDLTPEQIAELKRESVTITLESNANIGGAIAAAKTSLRDQLVELAKAEGEDEFNGYEVILEAERGVCYDLVLSARSAGGYIYSIYKRESLDSKGKSTDRYDNERLYLEVID